MTTDYAKTSALSSGKKRAIGLCFMREFQQKKGVLNAL